MDAIKKLGCTVDEQGSDNEHLVIDAPRGKLFICTNSHCLVEPLTDPFNPSLKKSDAYNEIIKDLAHRLCDCDDPECDNCHGDKCDNCEFSFRTGLEDEPKEGHVWCSEREQWEKCNHHCALYRFDRELPSREE